MRKLIRATAFGILALAASNSWATLVTNGDFESAALSSSGSFSIGSNFNKWIALSDQYALAGGPTGNFAQHFASGGQDHKLVQFIDASSLASGSVLELYFDYIYASSVNAQSNPKAVVSLIGISADRSYSMFGGGGVDGVGGGTDYSVAPPDVLLSQAFLDFSSTWVTDYLLSSTLGSSYFALGIIVQSGCYDPNTPTDCSNLRGVDNFAFNEVRVPEPGTLALFGLGLLGLGLSKWRKLN